ncbi:MULTISPECIES: hypothetical protein [unclassified Clostridium]|uniref:hypothetical protein n=1 Tax=unclassified Clostridium TaxID=2614128 RepID=UPI000297ADC6|nr:MULTISPECIES: hypothetical protein [unclassified Clostridium]EKQ56077.1 MAG: hypothetical protein A370_02299 [Clostridium sp. Maddingley MBC34-26]
MLRSELQPPKIDEKLVEELMKLIEEISELVDEYYEEYYEKNEKTILNDKIYELNSKVQKKYEPTDFQEYWGSVSLEDLAKEVSLPNPPMVNDITIEEAAKIIEMIVELKSPEGVEEVEEVYPYINYYIELLEKSITHNNISDLIYWYDVEEYGHEPSAREIAEKAFKTRENRDL